MPDPFATAAFAPEASFCDEPLDSEVLDRNEWVALFRDDQQRRWHRGERVLAEAYLERCAALGADGDSAFDLIANEVLLREETGETPTLEEYLHRFPAYAVLLRRRFALRGAVATGSIRIAPTGNTEKGSADATIVDAPPGTPAPAGNGTRPPKNDQTIQLDSVITPSAGRVMRLEGGTKVPADRPLHGLPAAKVARAESEGTVCIDGSTPPASAPDGTVCLEGTAPAAVAPEGTVCLKGVVPPATGPEGTVCLEGTPPPAGERTVAIPGAPSDKAPAAGSSSPGDKTVQFVEPSLNEQTIQFEGAPAPAPALPRTQPLSEPPRTVVDNGTSNGVATEAIAMQTVGFEVASGAVSDATSCDTESGRDGPVKALPAGARVPGYEILGILGKGGMGVVYKARQLGLNRVVALKMILHADHANAEDRERFRIEAEAVARLQHPNIVQIHEIGEHNGLPYFSLEFCPGGTLAGRLDGTPLPGREAAQLVLTMARAMQAAHEQKIVHRDLKPANVLRSADGQLKITDFGLAKKLDEAGQTQTGMIMGTPSYMAPEQAAGKINEIGAATDVYSLGAILYEMLTGRPPFKGTTALDTVMQVMDEEPVWPRQIQAKTPIDLETICMRCMDKASAKRYASAGDLAEDLRRFLDGEPIKARPTPLWERGVKWARRRPAAAGLIVTSIVAALALLILGWWSYVRIQAQLIRTNDEHIRAEKERREKEEAVAREVEQREKKKAVYHDSLRAGQDAMTRKDYTAAEKHFSGALKAIAGDPALNDLRPEAQKRHDAAAALVKVGNDFVAFMRHKDEALFHGTQLAGLDLAAGRTATREAAHKALELVRFNSDGPTTGFVSNPHWTTDQKAQVLTGCYELLLLLAEVEAGSAEGGKDEAARGKAALELLDRTRVLGLPDTRAYHQRRGRYLALTGKIADGKKEVATAKGIQLRLSIDHFFLGDELYREGNIARAERQFESALRLDPNHFWAQYFLAACQIKQGRFVEAKAGLIACLARRPDFVWAHLLLGYANGELKEFDLAEQDYQKALKDEEAHPDRYARFGIFLNRGAMRLQQKKPEKVRAAIADFEAARKLMPKEYQAYANLAAAYEEQKDLVKAAGQLEKALALAPDKPSLYRRRARLALARNDLAAALEDFDKAVGLELPGSPALAEDQAERGRVLYQMTKYAEAVEAFDAALKVRPDYPEAHLLRAEALLKLRRFKDAEAAFTAYLKYEKTPVASAYQGRGVARASLKDYAGAMDDYTRSLELEPGSAGMHLRRGWAYVLKAQQLALRDFDKAIELNPKDGDAYNGRGFVRVKLGQAREAVEDAEAALRCGGVTPTRRTNAACIFAQAAVRVTDKELTARWKERAVQLIEQALEAVPASGQAAFWRANVAGDVELSPLRDLPAYGRLQARFASMK